MGRVTKNSIPRHKSQLHKKKNAVLINRFQNFQALCVLSSINLNALTFDSYKASHRRVKYATLKARVD